MKNTLTYIIFVIFIITSGHPECCAQNLWDKRKKASYEAQGIKPVEKKKESAASKPAFSGRSGELGTLTVKNPAGKNTYYNPHSVFIPVKYGEIVEVHNANPVPTRPSKKLVINVQDVHCHYEAQKHIAHILEELIVNYGLKLILVEGNSKDASLKHLRKQATRKRRVEVGEDYLKRGMISGEEYLDLISDYDFLPLGIEDRELYLKNLDSFLAIDKFKSKAVSLMEDLEIICGNLKEKVFSKKLNDLTNKKIAMEKEELDFEKYCEYLLKKVEEKNLTLHFSKPNFDMTTKTVHLSKEMDFNKVNSERDFVISELSKELDEVPLQELLKKAKYFRTNQIKQSTFYNYLQELLANKLDWKSKFPELAKYIHYTNLHDTIDVIELFIELEKIESVIKERLYRNDDERTLDKVMHDIKILSEIIRLESAPYKYDYFLENENDFYVNSWANFLRRLSDKYRLEKKVPTNAYVVDNNLYEVKKFYNIAYMRDAVFLKKTKEHLENTGQNTAVMITGGFHSKHITQLFKNEGFSYMIISPKISEPVDQALYESVLKYKSNMIKR